MVNVPTTPLSSEPVRPISGQQNIPTTPGEFGATVGGALIQGGQSISRAGQVLSLVAERRQNDLDATNAVNNYNAFSDALRTSLTDLEELKGLDAEGLTTEATKRFDDLVKQHRQGLTQGSALRFDALAQGKRNSILDGFANIESQELTAAKNNQMKLGIDTEVKDAAKLAKVSTSLPELEKGIASKLTNIETFTRVLWEGQNEDFIQAKILEAKSALHKAVFDRLLLQNVPRAREYFERNKANIDGLITTAIEAKLKPAEKDFRASTIFQEIYDPRKSQADLFAAVRAKSKDEDVIKEAINQIRVQRAAEKQDEAAANAAAFNTLFDGVTGKDPNKALLLIIDAKKTSEWSALTPAQKASLIGIERNRTVALDLAAAELEAGRLRELARTNEAEFLGTKLKEIAHKITPARLKEFQDLQRSLENETAAFGRFKSNQQIIMRSLRLAGILPLDASDDFDDDEIKAKFAFEERFAIELKNFRARTGDDADDIEAQQIVDNLLIEITTFDPTTVFGFEISEGEETVRAFAVDPASLDGLDPLRVDDAAATLVAAGKAVTLTAVMGLLREERAAAGAAREAALTKAAAQ